MNARCTFLAGALFLAAGTVLSQCETHYFDRWQVRSNVSAIFTSGDCAVNLNDSMPYMNAGYRVVCHPLTGEVRFGCSNLGVVDASGTLMPNGMGISGWPIPKPSSARLYYLFSAEPSGTGLNEAYISYSVIDMDLRGGLGDFTAERAVPVPGIHAISFLAGIASPDGLTHHVYLQSCPSGYLHRFEINVNDGLVLTPDSQAVPINGTYGWLSPVTSISNDRMAWSRSENGVVGVEVMRVDPVSGTLSDPLFLPDPNNSPFAYAFSSLGNVLYTTTSYPQDITDPVLYQYDLSLSTADSVIASLTPIADGQVVNGNEPYLSTATDGRIYLGFVSGGAPTFSHLHYVDQPEVLGAGCNMLWNAIDIGIPDQQETYVLPNPIWPHLGMLSENVPEPLMGPLPTLAVQPNPSHGGATFVLVDQDAQPVELRLYDALGRQVVKRPWPAGSSTVQIEWTGLASGSFEASVLLRDHRTLITRFQVD